MQNHVIFYFRVVCEIISIDLQENISQNKKPEVLWYLPSPISQHDSFRGCLMMTSSNGNIFRVTGPLCGEFTGPGEFPTQRPVTRSFGVYFDLRPNKQLSKQSWGWWFETLSPPLWQHRNVRAITPRHNRLKCEIMVLGYVFHHMLWM